MSLGLSGQPCSVSRRLTSRTTTCLVALYYYFGDSELSLFPVEGKVLLNRLGLSLIHKGVEPMGVALKSPLGHHLMQSFDPGDLVFAIDCYLCHGKA